MIWRILYILFSIFILKRRTKMNEMILVKGRKRELSWSPIVAFNSQPSFITVSAFHPVLWGWFLRSASSPRSPPQDASLGQPVSSNRVIFCALCSIPVSSTAGLQPSHTQPKLRTSHLYEQSSYNEIAKRKVAMDTELKTVDFSGQGLTVVPSTIFKSELLFADGIFEIEIACI